VESHLVGDCELPNHQAKREFLQHDRRLFSREVQALANLIERYRFTLKSLTVHAKHRAPLSQCALFGYERLVAVGGDSDRSQKTSSRRVSTCCTIFRAIRTNDENSPACAKRLDVCTNLRKTSNRANT